MAAEVRFIMQAKLPGRWAKILPFAAQKIWERICSDLGDVTQSPTVVYTQDGQTDCVVAVGHVHPTFVRISLRTIRRLAAREITGSSVEERLFRAFRALACEELVHFHDMLMGLPFDVTLVGEEAIDHYCRESEYRALKKVVEYTGQRRKLLAKVEAARAKRE